jgi:hypothetical protein
LDIQDPPATTSVSKETFEVTTVRRDDVGMSVCRRLTYDGVDDVGSADGEKNGRAWSVPGPTFFSAWRMELRHVRPSPHASTA